MPARSGRGILERLKSGVVLGAEGYVFELERRGYIKAGPYVPEVVLDFPDALRELHRDELDRQPLSILDHKRHKAKEIVQAGIPSAAWRRLTAPKGERFPDERVPALGKAIERIAACAAL